MRIAIGSCVLCWPLALAALLGLLPPLDGLPLGGRFFGFATGVLTVGAGLLVVRFGLPRASVGVKLPLLVLLVLLAGFHWIVFGPGERVYLRSVGSALVLGGLGMHGGSGALPAPEGPLVFGLSALLLEGGLMLHLRRLVRRGGGD